ncbi:MAG: DNA-3-methyladenine glycosylase [Candidatus Obscuribacterales bacterium]|nr:DNA-3-methyladenine glycosylase [Candidatus Obscuribacterales bacterium]
MPSKNVSKSTRESAAEDLIKQSKKAMKHLSKVDAKLGTLIEEVGPFTLEIAHLQSSFEALARSIVYQQLAGAAAASIFNRVRTLISETAFPTPDELLALPEATVRAAGLSRSKTLALLDLAEKTKAGLVPEPEQMQSMSDVEIIAALTSIRGIGPWTVEMLLIFRLGRLDVMPATDYGVRKGFALTYGKLKRTATKSVKKTTTAASKPPDDLPTPKELTDYAEIWRPYRSIASWYMWRAVELHQARTKLENQSAPPKAHKKTPPKKVAQLKAAEKKTTATKARSRK